MRYQHNLRLLERLAPFRVLALSSGYLAPFMIEQGLSTGEILWLQAFYSIACVLWEFPSGMVADKIGAARCIKLSAPIAASAVIAYGLGSDLWHFALCELLLAIANGMLSGADRTLVYASLKAAGQADDETVTAALQRIRTRGFVAVGVGAPVAMLLVLLLGKGSVIVADGLLIAFGAVLIRGLVDPPQEEMHRKAEFASAMRNLRLLVTRSEVRWLITLTTTLATITYVGYWQSGPFLTEHHVPDGLFAWIYAVQNLWMAFCARKIHVKERYLGRAMWLYVVLALVGALALAGPSPWLGFLLIAHSTVRALQESPIVARLNGHMQDAHRASMNSVVALIERLSFGVTGIILGFTLDTFGRTANMLAMAAIGGALASVALLRLRWLGTFAPKD